VDDFKALKRRADRIQGGAIDDKYRTLGRRVYAGLVDMAILSAVCVAAGAGLLFVDRDYRYAVYELVTVPLIVVYPIVTTKVFGGTPGKLSFNLVVRTAKDEAPISWPQSLLRESISMVSNFVDMGAVFYFYFVLGQTSYQKFTDFTANSLPLQVFSFLAAGVFFLELATANASRTRRSIHDLIAGTVVLKTGPYRPWSNLIAVGLTVVAIAALLNFMPLVHN